jgi:pimeloyl-ACP methyl ester carboxylesterase
MSMPASPTVQSLFVEAPHAGGRHRIQVRLWKARAPSILPPLICVHGLTRHGGDFSRLAERLSATRDIYAPDMPGRGGSEAFADSALYNYAQYSADCTALLAHFNLTRVDWLGTSMGGLIGMMLAAAKDTPLRKLALNDIGPFLPLAAMQRIGAYVSKEMRFVDFRQAEIYCRQIYTGFGIKSDEDWREFAQSSIRPAEGGGYRLHYDVGIAKAFLNVTADVDAWGIYDAINIPVLLIRGEKSDTLLKETAEEMTRRGPKARLVTIAGVGHAPALLEEEQIEIVEEFLGN